MTAKLSDTRDDSLTVPWSNVVGFVRQLSHDLRNHLNASELQAAFIAELAQDAELKAEIKRLREMGSELATVLQKLSAAVASPKPNLMSYAAADLLEDVRQKIAKDFPKESAAIEWDIQVGDAKVEIDPQLVLQVFTELFTNAFQHERGKGAIAAVTRTDKNQLVFTLREPKEQLVLSTEKWGREPFGRVHHAHYGLGLNRARVIVEAHKGDLRARHDSSASTLVTTITLPLS